MPVAAYVRPATLDDALDALAHPGAMVIGGGTKITRCPRSERATIVDLQSLGLDRIEEASDGTLTIGATVTLQQLADHAAVPAAIREAARREAPSVLRTLATVAGCVATADPDSVLLACLLVHDARITLAAAGGARTVELAALLADRGQLTGRVITAAAIELGGVTAAARTGRTPADRAIVAAVARRTPGGEVRVAVTGMGVGPVLVDLSGGLAASLDRLDPRSDFRGSADYRRTLARVLARRVLEEVRA